VSSTIARIVEIVGARPTYFTLDVDGLDPAFAPGTGTPAPGGLSTAQALSIVRGLTAVDIIGADVVEVAPAYDHADITALAAAHVASELICLFRHRGCFAVETRELTATVSLPDSHGSTHLYRGSNFVIRIEE